MQQFGEKSRHNSRCSTYNPIELETQLKSVIGLSFAAEERPTLSLFFKRGLTNELFSFIIVAATEKDCDEDSMQRQNAKESRGG